MKKPRTGYDKSKKQKKKKNHYISSLLVANPKRVSTQEKIVKFLIYIALRLVIRPRRWKDPKKNYEIIDRTYNFHTFFNRFLFNHGVHASSIINHVPVSIWFSTTTSFYW